MHSVCHNIADIISAAFSNVESVTLGHRHAGSEKEEEQDHVRNKAGLKKTNQPTS